jgi:hypothetical protein
MLSTILVRTEMFNFAAIKFQYATRLQYVRTEKKYYN